ncbi:hypothetical protein [Mesorhizobium sp. J428]|uniref:hypothetical protein n=1 Tax=Mesorhizobium sp. J428 TaxID=2898440 RepID=UPI0021509527|nr:hypothetical protein [Mesorhizobium sp. J428]MCR5858127.1 hypothetical protein [Mesorhizobium sp. J428]
MTSRIGQRAIVDALIAGLPLTDNESAMDTIAKTFEVLSISASEFSAVAFGPDFG